MLPPYLTNVYRLEGKTPTLCQTEAEFLQAWRDNRLLKKSYLDGRRVKVCTIFLVIDHRHLRYGDHPPDLFETMVFGGPMDKECQCYETWDEAIKGHDQIVENCLRALDAASAASNEEKTSP